MRSTPPIPAPALLLALACACGHASNLALAPFSNAARAQEKGKPAAKGESKKAGRAEDAFRLDDATRRDLERELAEARELASRLDPSISEDLRADVEVGLKGVAWGLELDDFASDRDVVAARRALEIARTRARTLLAGEPPDWIDRPGSTARAFRSRIDGSIQPYAVIVPEDRDPGDRTPRRLDVVLHGRDANLNEYRFVNNNEARPPRGALPPGAFALNVYGRGNNAYRWAGETDVFEAIEAVVRNYPIDESRIVLRGFSMGGAGAWHLGLRFPTRWASVEAGAGFSETRRYARVENPSETVARALRIYDAVDYAENALMVPVVGYGGEEDPQLQASTNILEALAAKGFEVEVEGLVSRVPKVGLERVVGAGMGHRVDDASARIMAEFHDRALAAPRRGRDRIRFVTFTLKANEVGPFAALGLGRHYEPAILEGERDGDRWNLRTSNITRLEIRDGTIASVAIDGVALPIAAPAVLEQADAGWRVAERRFPAGLAKRPGLQGPIDDAFTDAFVCVEGTGDPWNPALAAKLKADLDEFARVWKRHLRADLPRKSDSDLAPDDVAGKHLVLWGDPGSNLVLRRLLPGLPIEWTLEGWTIGGRTFEGARAYPVLIFPNPENPERYVVLNSGHTFGEREFVGSNAQLYPRLGDFAAIDLDGRIVETGYFDESWRLPPR